MPTRAFAGSRLFDFKAIEREVVSLLRGGAQLENWVVAMLMIQGYVETSVRSAISDAVKRSVLTRSPRNHLSTGTIYQLELVLQ